MTLDLGSSGHHGTITQGYSSVAATIAWDAPAPPTVGGLCHFSPGVLPLLTGSFGSRAYIVGGTGEALEVELSGTSATSHRFRLFYHNELKPLGLDGTSSCLAELGRWRGTSTLQGNGYSSDPPLSTILRLAVDDEAFYVHSTRLTGHSGMDQSGRRSCIARIPMDSAVCTHWRNHSPGLDKFWLGSVHLNSIDFPIRDAHGTVSIIDKAISLQLLFTVAP